MLHFLIAGAMALAAPQQTDTTFAVSANGRLEVDNHAGSVKVQSWDRSDVRIQATHDAQTSIRIGNMSSTVSVEAEGEDGHVDTNVRYTINVPRSFRVVIDGVNTIISVEGVDGDVAVETVNGSVTVRNVTGRVDAESVSGLVVVEQVRGRVKAATTNQSVRLADVTGDVDAETVNGSIDMLDITSSNVTAETVNGSITLGSTIRDGGTYSLATTNGNVWIAVPEGTNATFETSTFSGKVETTMTGVLDRTRGNEQSFRLGSGSARVSIDAFSGTIHLVRPSEMKSTTPRKADK